MVIFCLYLGLSNPLDLGEKEFEGCQGDRPPGVLGGARSREARRSCERVEAWTSGRMHALREALAGNDLRALQRQSTGRELEEET